MSSRKIGPLDFTQARHSRFLAGNTATVLATSRLAVTFSVSQSPSYSSVLAVLPPLTGLVLILLVKNV